MRKYDKKSKSVKTPGKNAEKLALQTRRAGGGRKEWDEDAKQQKLKK